ncbi:MAG: hypothetical protein JRD89_02535 [Deltaproteobacteria bacterium]|nr:hypothetical protein [Deltaproteobacteria bacterium]
MRDTLEHLVSTEPSDRIILLRTQCQGARPTGGAGAQHLPVPPAASSKPHDARHVVVADLVLDEDLSAVRLHATMARDHAQAFRPAALAQRTQNRLSWLTGRNDEHAMGDGAHALASRRACALARPSAGTPTVMAR